MGDWHPMSTAPMQTGVIVCAGTDPACSKGLFVGEAYQREADEGWWRANTGPNDFDSSDPIYPIVWMPLPDVPKFEVA